MHLSPYNLGYKYYLTSKYFDFRFKIKGSTCQNVNYNVSLDCLEKNLDLSFLRSYWYKTLVRHGGKETVVTRDFSHTRLHQFDKGVAHGRLKSIFIPKNGDSFPPKNNNNNNKTSACRHLAELRKSQLFDRK